MKFLIWPYARLGARKNDALLFCNLGIILLCFAVPSDGRPLTAAAPGVLADFGILAGLALFSVIAGQSKMRFRALAWLIGFWLLAAFVVITARRWTPMVAPVVGLALAYICVVRWRMATRNARRERVLSYDAASTDPLATPRDKANCARDNEVMLQMMHDLRSPLSTILVMVEKQSAESNDPKQEAFAESVRELAQYSLTVAQDFMHLSRAERLDKANFLPVSLLDVGQEAADQAMLLAERKGIDVQVRECGEKLWVSGDYCMLQRAVMNLLDNAIKYSEADTRITLCLKRQGDMARISVIDEGIGIAESVMPQLCQAFFQVDPGARDGVGMGLALVATVVDAHGGKLAVDSRPNEGSEFSLTFPMMAMPCVDTDHREPRSAFRTGLNAAS